MPPINNESLVRTLAAGDAGAFNSLIERAHAADAANALEAFEPAQIAAALKLLAPKRGSEVFGYLAPAAQSAVARLYTPGDLARLMAAMSHDERADLYNRLDAEQQRALLASLAASEGEDIRRLAAYPEGTVGSIMTSDYAALSPDVSVARAIEQLRTQSPNAETIYDAYVIDGARRLIGVVSLRDLLLAPGEAPVADIMRRDVVCARTRDSREAGARKFADYDLLALPVVDREDKLVGIVTADDALDVAIERADRDFRRIVAVDEPVRAHGEQHVSLKDAGVWLLYRMRIVWLVALVFGNIFSGAGIAAFEDTIAAHVALVFFLPLLIDSGGNAGSQSATLMVRAMATGDVAMRDWRAMIGKEALVAGLLGLTMALAVSLIGVVRAGPEIALIVSLSMVLIVLAGSCIGMSLPFLLSRFGADPATASAPLVTSIADSIGVLIYFAIASAMLTPAATG